jgi:hypothetical protein
MAKATRIGSKINALSAAKNLLLAVLEVNSNRRYLSAAKDFFISRV